MWQAQQIAAVLYAMSAPPNYMLNQRPPHLASPAYDDNNGGDATDEENDEQSRTLYIGNLEDRVTEDLLYEIFLQAGPIESVRMPKDNNGRQRSFGFVVYTHRCTPSYATKLFAGLTLYRKSVIIKLQGEPNSTNKRRSLPGDCERYMSRSNDNSMLRSTSYPSFYDPSMNDHNNSQSSPGSNPFRTNSPDFGGNGGGSGGSNMNRSDRGSRGDRDRDRKMERDRKNSHSRAHPYQRDDRRHWDEGQRHRR